MTPTFDPDHDPKSLDLMDAILVGFTRITDPTKLRQYGKDWSEEIKASSRRGEVRLAYKNRMKELTNGQPTT